MVRIGWADSGDGSSCMAPANYQGARRKLHVSRAAFLALLSLGECGRKLEMGAR